MYIFEDTKDPENRYRRYRLKEEKNVFSDESLRRDYEAFLEAKNRSSQSKTEESFLSSVEDAERRELMDAIREAKGNLAKAARSLGISRQLIYYRVKKYRLK